MKKIVKIILLSLLAALGIAYFVLYCVFPQTKEITWQAIDYICNKPLPVIGISVLTLSFILYKLVKFIVNNKNIKINELKLDIVKTKAEFEILKENAEQEVNDLKEQLNTAVNELNDMIAFTNENVKEICNTIPNKKIQALGEKFYGDSSSETEEI